jgi:hypothetical protein
MSVFRFSLDKDKNPKTYYDKKIIVNNASTYLSIAGKEKHTHLKLWIKCKGNCWCSHTRRVIRSKV